MIDLAAVAGGDRDTLDQWRRRRWADVIARLDDLSATPAVDAFISDYALPLAERIQSLLLAGAFDLAAEIPADLMEELLRQAEAYAQYAGREGQEVAHQAVDERSSPVRGDHDTLALAAAA